MDRSITAKVCHVALLQLYPYAPISPPSSLVYPLFSLVS